MIRFENGRISRIEIKIKTDLTRASLMKIW